MKENKNKRFIVRKYIMAKHAEQALKIERKFRPDDVFLDEEFMKNQGKDLSSAIGFSTEKENYEH